MLLNALNGSIALNNAQMDYIRFGYGDKTLIMLPGLSDGLRTVKGMAIPFAVSYRAFAKRFQVYVFSRINQLKPGYSTKDMADDVKMAMDALGIASAGVLGVSQGGMIAQYLALDYPFAVEKLALAVTSSRPNPILREALEAWIGMARRGDYRSLIVDTAQRSYSDAYLCARRPLLALVGRSGGPKDYSRFIIEAESCLNHNAYSRLGEIRCPTLVLGGGDDRIVGAVASREIAGRIEGSCLHMYDGLGHAAYEEAKDFNGRLMRFFGE